MRESLADFCHREHREDLLAEWDSERNLPLTPETVSRGSKRRVFWHCANGHSWQAAVHTRSGSGTGCPYCSGLAKQTSQPVTQISPPNGIQPKTATSPRLTCSLAAIA